MNNYQNNTPDTALSVLELFQPTKQGISTFANQVAQNVKDGLADPLRVLMLLRAMEDISEEVRKAAKSEIETAASKWGDKPFIFHGVEFHYTSVKTEYKYDNCNDEEMNDLLMQEENLKVLIKKRQEFLKAL